MWWLPLIAQVAAAAPPDSVAALRVARSAQAAFERYRIAHLPRSRGGSRSSRCDEIVGRLCFWHGEDGGWQPSPDPPTIQAARRRLLDVLDSLAPLLPEDPWIAGQRVRYLVESEANTEALEAARGCRASGWWCAALLGYARHAGGDYPGADSAFAAALHAMPEDLRCRWTDLSPVLGGLRGRYRKLPCAQRVTLERRIWWLADPLYLVPGNERRTEHFSRRMMNALQDRAQSAYGMRWGTDLEELLIRYGWPVGWEQEAPVSANPGRPSIVSHNPPTTWHFLPPARFVEAPNTIGPEDWDLDPEQPVTSYAPPYARVFHVLPHQLAVFRRDDSMVVVASYDVRGTRREHGSTGRIIDERLEGRMVREVRAALALAQDGRTEPVIVRGTGSGPEGVMTAIAPAVPALLSIETLDTADSVHAARARYWLPVAPLTGGVTVSDPLLLRSLPADSLHPSLADVLPLVRPVARAQRGERVGIFWETYGLERSARPVRITLSVTRVSRSWIRQAAEWAGLASRDPGYVSLSWEETPPAGVTVYPRALAIAMPEASPGTYALELTVAAPGSPIARTRRNLIIEP
jgi:hypothetical protein